MVLHAITAQGYSDFRQENYVIYINAMKNKNGLYTVTYSCGATTYDQLLPVLIKVLESFKLT